MRRLLVIPCLILIASSCSRDSNTTDQQEASNSKIYIDLTNRSRIENKPGGIISSSSNNIYLTSDEVSSILTSKSGKVKFMNNEIASWSVENGRVLIMNDVDFGRILDLPGSINSYNGYLSRLKMQAYSVSPVDTAIQVSNNVPYCSFYFIFCWSWSTQVVNSTGTVRTFEPRWPNAIIPYGYGSSASQNLIDSFTIAKNEWNAAMDTALSQSTVPNKKAPKWDYQPNNPERVMIGQEYDLNKTVDAYVSVIGFDRVAGVQYLTANYARQSPSKGLLLHEMGHVAGLFHEHIRPDRDDFIIVNTNNSTSPDFFAKDPSANGTWILSSYDYESIMHYNPKATGKIINGSQLTVMFPKQPPNGTYFGNPAYMGRMISLTWADKNSLIALYTDNNPPTQ